MMLCSPSVHMEEHGWLKDDSYDGRWHMDTHEPFRGSKGTWVLLEEWCTWDTWPTSIWWRALWHLLYIGDMLIWLIWTNVNIWSGSLSTWGLLYGGLWMICRFHGTYLMEFGLLGGYFGAFKWLLPHLDTWFLILWHTWMGRGYLEDWLKVTHWRTC